MPNLFIGLQILSWTLAGLIYAMLYYGAEEQAYKYGKLVLAFLAGQMAVLAVV